MGRLIAPARSREPADPAANRSTRVGLLIDTGVLIRLERSAGSDIAQLDFSRWASYGDAQRIGQLSLMLFLKIFDQAEDEWEDDASDQVRTYRSPIPPDCRWRNGAAF